MTGTTCLTNLFSEKKKAAQVEFWVATHQMPKSPKATFYSKLDETLESFGFAGKVREICASAYKQTTVGRPGIDPVVYLKRIMVGFFEDLPSERAIAARCADSIAIRRFLNYELDENTPEHSKLDHHSSAPGFGHLSKGIHALPGGLAGARLAAGQASGAGFFGD